MDFEKMSAKKESLKAILEKIDQAQSLVAAKLTQSDSPHWNPSRAEKIEQKLKALAAEKEHILFQLDELEKGLIFNNSQIRNGVIQPSDTKLVADETLEIDENSTVVHLSGSISPDILSKLSQLSALHTLCLSRCELTTFPLQIFQITNLQKLDLSNNQINSIPAEISKLKQLTYLSLTNNLLEFLPLGWTSGFQNLELLNLSHNKLSQTPFEGEMQECLVLTSISLAWNQFSTIPLAILVNCRALKRVYLTHNQIDEIPEEIENLRFLEWVALDHNKIKDIGPLGRLTTLTGVNLAFNLIEKEPVLHSPLKVLVVDGNPYTNDKKPQEFLEN